MARKAIGHPPQHSEILSSNFREKIGLEVVWRAMSPLAILSILIVLVLPVPGDPLDCGLVDGLDSGDGDGDVYHLLCSASNIRDSLFYFE